MAADVKINGTPLECPAGVDTLEALLVHVMEQERNRRSVIVEVSLNGQTFSEAYRHQAREIALESGVCVEISTRDQGDFAEDFLLQLPEHIDYVSQGLTRAIELLREPDTQAAGFDLLGRSLGVLQALAQHLDEVRKALARTRILPAVMLPWETFAGIPDRIMAAQETGDPVIVADILESEMLPCLSSWREGVDSVVH